MCIITHIICNNPYNSNLNINFLQFQYKTFFFKKKNNNLLTPLKLRFVQKTLLFLFQNVLFVVYAFSVSPFIDCKRFYTVHGKYTFNARALVAMTTSRSHILRQDVFCSACQTANQYKLTSLRRCCYRLNVRFAV